MLGVYCTSGSHKCEVMHSLIVIEAEQELVYTAMKLDLEEGRRLLLFTLLKP